MHIPHLARSDLSITLIECFSVVADVWEKSPLLSRLIPQSSSTKSDGSSVRVDLLINYIDKP